MAPNDNKTGYFFPFKFVFYVYVIFLNLISGLKKLLYHYV